VKGREEMKPQEKTSELEFEERTIKKSPDDVRY